MSATAYSIYSKLSSILEAAPPSAIWGCDKSWRQGPTCHGQIVINVKYINCTDLRSLDSEKQNL